MTRATKEQIRVLHVLPFNKKGGLPLRTYRVSKRLNKNTDINNIMVVPDTNGAFYKQVTEENIVDIYKINFTTPTYFDSGGAIRRNIRWALNFIPSVVRFKRFIHQHEIDVVHINEIFLLQAGIGSVFTDANIAWHLISDQFPSWFIRGLMPIVDSIADLKMVVTEANLNYYFGPNIDIDSRSDIMIVPGVADTDQFDPSSVEKSDLEDLQDEFNIEDEVIITTVANLNPTKGIEYALRALSEISVNFKYLVVGEKDNDEYVNNLAETVEKNGMKENVVFTGYREDVQNILSISDIFILPSLGEGTPLTLIEAMSMGVPIVATDVGGVRNMLNDGAAGQIVPPKSASHLREAIVKYVSNPELMEQAGQNGRMIALNQFSIESLTNRYMNAYKTALDNK